MATRNSLAERAFDLETGLLIWTFADKETEEFDVAAFAGDGAWTVMPDAAKMGLAHGVGQKGTDSYASAGTKADDAGMTPVKWARAQCRAVLSALRSGDWTRAGTGGGGEPALLVEALSRVFGVTIDDAEAKVEAASKEAKKAMRADARIAPVIAAIKVERDERRLARSKEQAAAAAAAAPTEALPSFEQFGA